MKIIKKSIDKKVSFLDYKYKKERSKHYFNYEKRKKQVQKQKGDSQIQTNQY